MSARNELNSYIASLEKRLRLTTLLQGAAILVSSALLTTVLLVVIINLFAFSGGSVTGARFLLLLAIVSAAGLGLAIPLTRLTRRHAVGSAEKTFPQFQQRLVTFAERDQDGREPFIELLAADTLKRIREAQPERLVPNSRLMAFAGAGVASLIILIWMILAGPGFLGYGASLLWTGQHADKPAFYDIKVTPGDATVRRNADQLVTALPVGVQTNKVRLYARYQSTSKWEQVTMQPQAGASGFQFLFAGLPEAVEYYIEAGAVRSRHFNIRVVDLPGVKKIRVTYHFPAWTDLHDVVEERGGDLRAVEGTQADLEVTTDRPVRNGILQVDDQQVQLSGGQGNVYRGTVNMVKDGMYHVAALDQGQPVRLSEDFFIEANKAKPPDVQIVRPGRDYRASPIEEVTVAVKANDDFGINDMNLHYSVNGGPEQSVNVLKQKGAKEADGSTVLYMENYKMVPGDVVSVYATAKDARAESRTDMFFIQADPFEREFSQSQSAGGGGGGGGGGGAADQNISQREKEIIASTWKQQNDKEASAKAAAEASKFLSSVQSTLADQARSLSYRMQSRELSGENDEFTGFVKDMDAAAASMAPASKNLKDQKWAQAIPDEQKALQHLLRAEATFRQIQVAFGAGGGGGGGGGAGRDLASLFDLELDTEKNQYETGQTGSSADQRAKEIDDALKKLDELARREEELAQQQRNNAQTFQQRWQQEMLRRDAEQLQKQLQQLAQQQNGQQQNGQQGSSSGSQGQSASGSQSSSSQSSSGQSASNQSNPSGDPRAQQALDRLQQANDDLKRAASQQGGEAEARRAADRLREATNLLSGMQQQATGQLDSLAREAKRLSDEHQSQDERLNDIFGPGGTSSQARRLPSSRQEQGKLADDRQRLADDLAKLEQQMRNQERELASSQRDASSKLRDALGQIDQDDLQTRLQRTADWLRRGINPDTNGTEGEIGSGLQRLADQMRDAQQALGQSGPQQSGSQSAVDSLERLRNQLEALNPNSRQAGQRGQQGGQGNAAGQQGNQRGGQQGGAQQGGQYGQAGQRAYSPLGGPGARIGGGDTVGGDGYRNGTLYGNVDTGNNSELPQPVGPDRTPIPADPEVAIQQGLNELNQLRQTVQDDPESAREVQALINEMQHLDPRRFPGNPAIVEQLHNQVLSDVDKLELQLRRTQDEKQTGQVRSNDAAPVPTGYEDAVAEYFRRLSKRP